MITVSIASTYSRVWTQPRFWKTRTLYQTQYPCFTAKSRVSNYFSSKYLWWVANCLAENSPKWQSSHY